jgi:archaellum biogenesis ATPase FlaH
MIYVALVVATLVVTHVPGGYGAACQVQVNGVNYPTDIVTNETITITTSLTVTCNPINENVSARVDVISLATDQVIATNSYEIGTIQTTTVPTLQHMNVTVSNILKTPATSGSWSLELQVSVFAGADLQATATKTIQFQVGAASTSTAPSNLSGIGTTDEIGLVLTVAVIVSLLALFRRRSSRTRAKRAAVSPQAEHPTAVDVEANVGSGEASLLSTGYQELDTMLGGGLPTDRAVLIVSGPWDEKELLLNKIVGSALTYQYSVYFLSRDLGRSQDLARKYAQNFYVLTPRADKISSRSQNILEISDVRNLNDINISFDEIMRTMPSRTAEKMVLIDFLSDILLEHGGVTTRKWLDDFITRRESEGFMVIATLNPSMVRPQENQQVIELFSGVIEIYEIPGRPRRFLIIRKMYGRKYIESELMLNRDKLF